MRKAVLIVLVVCSVAAAGLWLRFGDGSSRDPSGDSRVMEVPGFLRGQDPDRLFCATSPDTGVCRCIAADGRRPEIPDAECRRRARESAADVE